MVLLLCSLVFPSLAAAEVPDFKQEATNLMQKGNYSEANKLLLENYPNNKEDMETNFLLGLCSYQLGKQDKAIEYYQTILAKDSSLLRVRLELAKAYAANGQKKEAKAELNTALASNPPPVAGENIKRFISLLDAQKDTNIRVTMGYLFDDNVNQGPISNVVEFFGLPFILNPESQKQSDQAITINLVVDNLTPLSKDKAWQTNFSYNRTDYKSLSDYDSDQISFSTGPLFKKPGQVISLPIIYNHTSLGSKDYSFEFGLSPQIQYNLSQKDALILSSTVKNAFYYDDIEKNSHSWGINLANRHMLNESSFLQLGCGYKKETANSDAYSNKSNSISLGYYTSLPQGYSFFIQPSYSWNKYDQADIPGNDPRDEKQYVLVANLGKTIGDWSYALGYTYIKNDSNVSIHEYKRNQVTLQVSKNF